MWVLASLPWFPAFLSQYCNLGPLVLPPDCVSCHDVFEKVFKAASKSG